MIPTRKIILAVCHVIRTMPRAPGDWTADKLTDEQHAQWLAEVAYTVGSMDERDVRGVLGELDTRDKEAA